MGSAWALLVPPWQAPDENSHFGYAQTLAERFDLPGDENRRFFTTEQDLATSWSNADQTAASLATKPEWSKRAYDRWRTLDRALPDSARRDGGGPNPASTNPPLYYLYVTPAYLATSGGDIFDRLYLMRLWSMLLVLVTATGAWLLAGELFDRDRRLQLAAAAVAGLQPMVMFTTASVNPDALLFALWSIALWLGVRILKRGLTPGHAIALFGVVGLAVATKATGYALLPAALLVLAVGVVRLRRRRIRAATVICAALVAFAMPAGSWLATAAVLDRPAVNKVDTGKVRPAPTITSFNARELASYVWQFYLPRLPFQQEEFEELEDLPVYDTWVKTGWAAFGWLEVRFPEAVYLVLAAFSVAAIAAAGVAVAKRRRTLDLAVVAFFAVAGLVLLAGLHWTEFRTLVGGSGALNQGRYLLPLISLGGAAVAAALSLLPERRRAPVLAVLLASVFALQIFSLAIVAGRFYA